LKNLLGWDLNRRSRDDGAMGLTGLNKKALNEKALDKKALDKKAVFPKENGLKVGCGARI
jgi:hypothetical protein